VTMSAMVIEVDRLGDVMIRSKRKGMGHRLCGNQRSLPYMYSSYQLAEHVGAKVCWTRLVSRCRRRPQLSLLRERGMAKERVPKTASEA
jgi:hypothetical protein